MRFDGIVFAMYIAKSARLEDHFPTIWALIIMTCALYEADLRYLRWDC